MPFRERLRALLDAALAAADPFNAVAANLPTPPPGRVAVVGAGKASARMARAFEQAWDGPLSGLVVTRYGYAEACERIEVVEAAHPVPDSAGETASRRILDLASELGADDLLVVLLSGGGSALLTVPADGVSLADEQRVTGDLLRAGATIGELNVVRKHISAIKGGRLAVAAHPARVEALVVSDVVGDDVSVIASGPTVGETSTVADARAVLARHGIEPVALSACPTPDDPRFARSTARVILRPLDALTAAAAAARELGLAAVVLGEFEGAADEVAGRLARRALDYSGPRPAVLLSGGEVTVDVRGDGVGGPNAEFALALAVALDGAPGIAALAADTDGVDGAAEVAGAVVTPDTLARAAARGLDPARSLRRNDAHTFFAALGDQVVTGPTRTNVNDFRAIVIE